MPRIASETDCLQTDFRATQAESGEATTIGREHPRHVANSAVARSEATCYSPK